MIWFTSDLHFGHEGVIRYCNRPYQSVSEMDEALTRAWNRWVFPDHTVYLLGDACFDSPRDGMHKLSSLNGKKVLIQGNHDKWSHEQYRRCGFQVFDELVLRLAGHRVRLSHYPYKPTPEELAEMEGHIKEYRFYHDKRPPRLEGEWLLHGHCHTAWKQRGNQINVGVDVWDYRPVSMRQIESLIGKATTVKV